MWRSGVVLHDTTATASRTTGSVQRTCGFRLGRVNHFLALVFSVEKLNTTLQPIYLKAIDKGPFPVATVGVVSAVSIPVAALIAYIDTVRPPSLAT